MPWCEECAKYWTPNSMNDDGTCPKCGMQVVAPETDEETAARDADENAPWHFKLMVVALVVYLGWRFVAIFT
jgi:hypothetical protein